MRTGMWLRVVGDHNDGDLIEEWSDITRMGRKDMNELIEDLIKVRDGDLDIDDLDENSRCYLPSTDYADIHSIESIEVVEITSVKEY